MACMNFILRVVCTSYLTSCASSELNMMFIQWAK